ncbi:MAG: FAD-binding oxidoreductase, partial [Pseudomonadales bacterium]|nr:FAD-binding oxidoreductase [Pseudomonadales bacterium]
EFQELANARGLAFPTAHTNVVGMGGFLLGGGLGWNLQKWDISCRSVLGAEIVTADGELIQVNEKEHPDLLWAIRGAGPGFFGIIVRYHVKMYPMPRAITKSSYIVTEEHIPMAVEQLQRLAKEKDINAEILGVLKHSADIPGMPKEGIAFIVSVIAFADSAEQAQKILAPFAASPIADKAHLKKVNRPHTFSELFEGQLITDATAPDRTSIDNMWTDNLGNAVLKMVDILRESPSKRSFVITVWGVNPSKRTDTALPHFADDYMSYYALADKPEHIEPNYLWMDKIKATMDDGFAKGHYINETEFVRYPEHIKQCFTEEGWKRLETLRTKYDPQSVFHTYIGYS